MKHILGFSLLVASSLFADVTIYVSPNGSSSADGSKASPYSTLQEARDSVRKLRKAGEKGNIKVLFADGTYKIKDKVMFRREDAAPKGSQTIYAAENLGNVSFDAGVEVPKFYPLAKNDPNYSIIQETVRSNILVADLRTSGITDYGVLKAMGVGDIFANGMELVWDGKLQTLSRWPNEGYTGIKAVPPKKEVDGKKLPQDNFQYKDERSSLWVNEKDPYANGFFCHNWAAARIAIKSIDPNTQTIVQKGRGSPYGYSTIGFWFGFNLLCELDVPGEYYIDRELGRLYFYPPKGKAKASSRLTFAKSILDLEGISNIAFAGIVFENSRGTPITGKYLNNVAIKRCAIKNTGGAAISINYSQNCTIAGCDVSYCLAGGIIASGGNHMKLEKSGIVIRNNHIHNYALGELTYCGAVKINGCGTKIINNTIHDGPHGAIFFGGKENEISYNEIHSVCLDSGEMGAIYTGRDWTLCGNVINANFIHDIYNPRPQRNRAIMLDDGCAGITMTSNIFLRVAEAISLSAIGNVIENNIFVDNHPAISCWQKWEKQEDYTNPRYTHTQLLTILESHKPQEEPWKSKYPYLAMIDDAIKTGKMRDPATRTKIANNLIYSSTTNWCQFMTSRYKYTPETWLLEDNHQVTESVFMNPAKDDYRVKPSADVLKEGFKQLPDVTQIGVYDSKERFSWPVSHPVTVKCNSFTFKKK